MRSEREIVELKAELESIMALNDLPIGSKLLHDKSYHFLLNTLDTLEWIMKEVTTTDFYSDKYLDLERFRKILHSYRQ